MLVFNVTQVALNLQIRKTLKLSNYYIYVSEAAKYKSNLEYLCCALGCICTNENCRQFIVIHQRLVQDAAFNWEECMYTYVHQFTAHRHKIQTLTTVVINVLRMECCVILHHTI